ncbi:hypothetical protein SY89_01276 [Halolamina pelagica]|uniref:Inner membrane protein n=1 Tax=Halolamina pelagica TaxID=699431 RepID=A0A0P7HUU9_9EURY|nr:metal-dependent hydrolase [Halolamina pelagica]KPN30541.1 hypothetical protein SY89_01276 [Halolamina pelagica]
MPSTLVHVAVGGLVGAALLGDRFTPKAIAVVLVAAAIPDLDSFLAPVIGGAHRSALHTLLLPVLLGTVLYVDSRVLDRSRIRERWGRVRPTSPASRSRPCLRAASSPTWSPTA